MHAPATRVTTPAQLRATTTAKSGSAPSGSASCSCCAEGAGDGLLLARLTATVKNATAGSPDEGVTLTRTVRYSATGAALLASTERDTPRRAAVRSANGAARKRSAQGGEAAPEGADSASEGRQPDTRETTADAEVKALAQVMVMLGNRGAAAEPSVMTSEGSRSGRGDSPAPTIVMGGAARRGCRRRKSSGRRNMGKG